jgi:positive regulator of sigma E activity
VVDSSEHCKSCRLCMVDGKDKRILEVYNGIKAETGDRVEVFIPVGVISKFSLSVFIFPIISFLTGYLIVFSLTDGEVPAVIGGFTALVLTFFLIWVYDRRQVKTKKNALPYISKIIEHKKTK